MRYRIDFSYWHYGSGYSHIETFDVFDAEHPTIKDYINNSDLEWDQFSDYCDGIMIEMWRSNGNKLSRRVSSAWWDKDGLKSI